jgi:phosphoribosylaminoimidazole-succinocarboxamide synthase
MLSSWGVVMIKRLVPDPLGDGYVEVLGASDLFGAERPPRRGKVRDVYDMGGELLIVTTDRISAFDVVFPTLIPHKGRSIHALSEYWFERTKEIFPNHFIESLDDRTMRVVKAERIDIEWICRGYLYGSAWRAYRGGARAISGVRLPDGLIMGEELPEAILTPTTKSEVGHDRELSRREALEAGLVEEDEWDELEEATYRLYEFYRAEARRRGIIIPDFKLEYGRLGDQLIQIDEPPTHDSARFWDERFYRAGAPQESHSLDKEFLREYCRRVGYIGEGPPPEIPWPVVCEVSKRCVASFEVLTGRRCLKDFELKGLEEVIRM